MLGKMRTETLYWYIGLNTMVTCSFSFRYLKVACIRSVCASNYHGRWKITHTVFKHCNISKRSDHNIHHFFDIKSWLNIMYTRININRFINWKFFKVLRLNNCIKSMITYVDVYFYAHKLFPFVTVFELWYVLRYIAKKSYAIYRQSI